MADFRVVGAVFMADAAHYKPGPGRTGKVYRAWRVGEEQFFQMRGGISAVRCTSEVFEAHRKVLERRADPKEEGLKTIDTEFRAVLLRYEVEALPPEGARVVQYDPTQPEPALVEGVVVEYTPSQLYHLRDALDEKMYTLYAARGGRWGTLSPKAILQLGKVYKVLMEGGLKRFENGDAGTPEWGIRVSDLFKPKE